MTRPPAHASIAASPIDVTAAAPSRSTLTVALVGSLLTYLAHPPMGWSLLAWLGPTPWLLLVRTPRLAGRRPYRALWLAGAAFWLVTVQWIRLPYWANIFFLFALAAYLGLYLPLFVGLSRVAVHRLCVPLWIAGPVVWTGLEWARARLLSGFLMASLAHTQAGFPRVIQIADLVGEYGVTFLIVLVAAAVASALPVSWACGEPLGEPNRPRRLAALQLLPAAIALAAALTYGDQRLLDLALQAKTGPQRAAPRIALIQSNMLANWKYNANRDDTVMREQMDLSRQAVRQSKQPIDVVIWPETMYRDPLWTIDPDRGPPLRVIDQKVLNATPQDMADKTKELGAALLVGLDRLNLLRVDEARGEQGEIDVAGETLPYRVDPFNSSAAVDRTGKLVGTYDKMHVLPFGEYMPFAEWLPFLQRFSPVTGVSLWGAAPQAFELDGVVYSPNICYETVLPHLIRQQVVELARRGQTPDVLVNLTNDAWYWGSSELDMHLASGVFRAVEMRTPLVVAANRGLSAHIDHRGRVVAVTQRNKPASLVTDVRLPPRRGAYPSLYARYGDWFSLGCLVCSGVIAIIGWRETRSAPRTPRRG